MGLTAFEAIYARAVARTGEHALKSRFPEVLTTAELEQVKNDRFLSAMARCIFAAGFQWRVVDAKWPGIEDAFLAFSPERLATWSVEELGVLLQDPRVIRHRTKLAAILTNAAFVCRIAEQHGGFGAFVARWTGDPVGLWLTLKREGARLGGNTGPRALRQVGFDTYLLTDDVVTALIREGVVARRPTAMKDLYRVQEAMLRFREESGLSLAAVSVTLACSVP